MSYSDALLSRAITDGLLAQRKLDGEVIYGPSDPDELQAIVSQGKRAEARLRRDGLEPYIKGAYERAHVKYPLEAEDGKQG